jgi:hypothetical protein
MPHRLFVPPSQRFVKLPQHEADRGYSSSAVVVTQDVERRSVGRRKGRRRRLEVDEEIGNK